MAVPSRAFSPALIDNHPMGEHYEGIAFPLSKIQVTKSKEHQEILKGEDTSKDYLFLYPFNPTAYPTGRTFIFDIDNKIDSEATIAFSQYFNFLMGGSYPVKTTSGNAHFYFKADTGLPVGTEPRAGNGFVNNSTRPYREAFQTLLFVISQAKKKYALEDGESVFDKKPLLPFVAQAKKFDVRNPDTNMYTMKAGSVVLPEEKNGTLTLGSGIYGQFMYDRSIGVVKDDTLLVSEHICYRFFQNTHTWLNKKLTNTTAHRTGKCGCVKDDDGKCPIYTTIIVDRGNKCHCQAPDVNAIRPQFTMAKFYHAVLSLPIREYTQESEDVLGLSAYTGFSYSKITSLCRFLLSEMRNLQVFEHKGSVYTEQWREPEHLQAVYNSKIEEYNNACLIGSAPTPAKKKIIRNKILKESVDKGTNVTLQVPLRDFEMESDHERRSRNLQAVVNRMNSYHAKRAFVFNAVACCMTNNEIIELWEEMGIDRDTSRNCQISLQALKKDAQKLRSTYHSRAMSQCGVYCRNYKDPAVDDLTAKITVTFNQRARNAGKSRHRNETFNEALYRINSECRRNRILYRKKFVTNWKEHYKMRMKAIENAFVLDMQKIHYAIFEGSDIRRIKKGVQNPTIPQKVAVDIIDLIHPLVNIGTGDFIISRRYFSEITGHTERQIKSAVALLLKAGILIPTVKATDAGTAPKYAVSTDFVDYKQSARLRKVLNPYLTTRMKSKRGRRPTFTLHLNNMLYLYVCPVSGQFLNFLSGQSDLSKSKLLTKTEVKKNVEGRILPATHHNGALLAQYLDREMFLLQETRTSADRKELVKKYIHMQRKPVVALPRKLMHLNSHASKVMGRRPKKVYMKSDSSKALDRIRDYLKSQYSDTEVVREDLIAFVETPPPPPPPSP